MKGSGRNSGQQSNKLSQEGKDFARQSVFAPFLNLDIFQDPDVLRAQQTLNEEEGDDIAATAREMYGNYLSGLMPPYKIAGCGEYVIIETDKGKGVKRLIEEAQESIFVTHFTEEEYAPEYVEAQVRKVREGLPFTRIYGKIPEPANPDYLAWLGVFFEERRPIGQYKQYRYDGTLVFWDIMIIDMQKVLVWYRADPDLAVMNRAVLFNDKELAKVFRNIWSAFLPAGEEPKETRFLVEEETELPAA